MSQGDHFSAVAGAYATYRPTYPAALFAWLAGLPASPHRVWDCGAGSGQASEGLLLYFPSVVATDISRAQLGAGRPNSGLHRIAAAAEFAPLAAQSVDLVIVAQALHWFEHEAFYREVRRVLRPGGAIAVWSYDLLLFGDRELDTILHEFNDVEVGAFWPRERRLVIERYRGISLPFAEVAVPEFAMTADWTLDELLGYVGTWSAVSRYRVAQQADPLPKLGARLERRWGARDARRRIEWPLIVRAATWPDDLGDTQEAP